MTRRPMLALYSATHFWVDLSCALLLFRTLALRPDFPLYLLIYNFCAFALQMPLGLLADRWNRNGLTAAAGCLLISLAYLFPRPGMLAVTAGAGNALFHLGGGIDILNRSGARAASLGVFISPGALGLYLGTLWGKGAALPLWPAPAGLLALAAAILLGCRAAGFRSQNSPPALPPLKRCKPLLPLFLVVALRSYMGMNQSFDWKSQSFWAWALLLALVLGKAAGGFAMDRLGAKKASALSLTGAAALYLLSGFPLPGVLAVLLFNMTMPVTLWAAARALPGAKGLSFGLLTFGLFVGFLPSALGWPNLLQSPWAYAAAALVSLSLLWAGLRNQEGL